MTSLEPPDLLLIEDNPLDVEMTLRVLNKNHALNSIRVIRDGAEAVDYLFAQGAYAHRDVANGPKVILLDLKLPKVSGLNILRRLKTDERTKVIPVVILTSSREDRDVVDSYRLGVNSYVVKPVDGDNFSQAVSQLGLYWMILNQPLRG